MNANLNQALDRLERLQYEADQKYGESGSARHVSQLCQELVGLTKELQAIDSRLEDLEEERRRAAL